MNGPSPPENANAPLTKGRREKLTGWSDLNSGSRFAQGFVLAIPVRCCVRCAVPVENFNLGGHDAPSAFRGPLWCLRCADGRPQERRGQ
jgi:hypothetical protein